MNDMALFIVLLFFILLEKILLSSHHDTVVSETGRYAVRIKLITSIGASIMIYDHADRPQHKIGPTCI